MTDPRKTEATAKATDRKMVLAVQDLVWFEKTNQEVYHHLACKEQAQNAIYDSPFKFTKDGEARLQAVEVEEGTMCDFCGKVITEVPELSSEEEADLREHARHTFDPTVSFIDPEWHPIYQDECRKILAKSMKDQETPDMSNAHMDGDRPASEAENYPGIWACEGCGNAAREADLEDGLCEECRMDPKSDPMYTHPAKSRSTETSQSIDRDSEVIIGEETLQHVSVALRTIVLEKSKQAGFKHATGWRTYQSLLEEVGYPDVSWI